MQDMSSMRLKPVVAVMLLILFGSLTGPARAADVPLPPNLRITAPDSSIPPEIAGFSGKWAGEWSGGGVPAGTPHILVVLKIDPADANGQYPVSVIYAWGANLAMVEPRKGGFVRADGVIKNGQLIVQLSLAKRFTATYRLTNDRRALEGEWHGEGARHGQTGAAFGTFRKE